MCEINIVISTILIIIFLVSLSKGIKTKIVFINRNENIMTYNATTIANYFIKEHKSDNMTPMKVIKLTYLSYCWYLALTKSKKLINEKAVAWDFGPVFPSLYQSIREYGKTSITTLIPSHVKEDITPEDKKFLDKIWSMYGKYDGVYLSALTHKMETPWQKVYCKGCNSEINDEHILEHYSSKLKTTA